MRSHLFTACKISTATVIVETFNYCEALLSKEWGHCCRRDCRGSGRTLSQVECADVNDSTTMLQKSKSRWTMSWIYNSTHTIQYVLVLSYGTLINEQLKYFLYCYGNLVTLGWRVSDQVLYKVLNKFYVVSLLSSYLIEDKLSFKCALIKLVS